MTEFDNRYSRFIAWAKIILPLVALGLLSTLFLVSKKFDPTQTIPYAEIDVAELAREQRITAPDYSGVTEDGAAVSIRAESAKPDLSDMQTITVSNLRAVIETPDGIRYDISAGLGVLKGKQKIADLSGNVEFLTSNGYLVQTPALTADLARTGVSALQGVQATGPVGQITAAQMRLAQSVAAEGRYVLVFKGGVKLVYDPKG